MEDYYATLGLHQDADEVVIRAAYKALAQRYHPDKAPGNEARMQAINAAYAVLSDPEQRRRYDARYQSRRPAQPEVTETVHPAGGAAARPVTIRLDAALLGAALWAGLRGAIQGGLLFALIFGLVFGLLGALGGVLFFGVWLTLGVLAAWRQKRWRGLLFWALLGALLALLAEAVGSAREGATLGLWWGGLLGALLLGLVNALAGLFQAALARRARF